MPNPLANYVQYPEQQALSGVRLSEGERNLLNHHLRNAYGVGGFGQSGVGQDVPMMGQTEWGVPSPQTATVYQSVVGGGPESGGMYQSIPTVWDGKILDPDDARRRALASRLKWPEYATPDEAQARYELMHQYFGK